MSPDSIDSVICAELSDKRLFPKLYCIVYGFIVHGPCGFARPSSLCMKDQRCFKFYLKKIVSRTSFDENGYPVYRRRDIGFTVLK